MWYLINSAGQRFYLKSNKEVTFGRKKSDILLQNDESISRLHASICIKPKEIVKTDEPTSTCELKDMGSKYGTYIILNETEKIEVTTEGYKLKDKDTIRFGLQFHTFTVAYIPIITVVSSMNDTDKIKLQCILDEIDGMISAEWTCNCTHLTVSKANLTEKVTWAMASAVPIVNLSYWEETKCAVDNGKELPKPIDFVPPIKETLVNSGNASLSVNEKRQTLFKNLIFVHFSTRQFKMFGRMINMAGGKSLLYSKKPLSIKELCAPNVIVLQYSDNDSTQSTQTIVPEYDTIYNALRASKRKMISETEIPLAILYCSVKKHCNPKFSFTEFLKRSQLKSDSAEVLALDTQDVMSDVRVLPKVISNIPIHSNLNVKTTAQEATIIPESYDSTYSSSNDISQSQDRWKTMPIASQDTKNPVNNNISMEKENTKKVKEIKYIPETNDLSLSDVSQNDTQCSIRRTPSLRQKDTNSQEIALVKESMIANKGSPSHEVIDVSDEEEEDNKFKDKRPNEKECNKISNNILSQEKLDKLLSAHSLEDEDLKVKENNSSQKNYILTVRVDHKNTPKAISQTVEKHVKKPTERNKRSVELQDDEEFVKPTSKRFCLENSVVKSSTSLCSENHDRYTSMLSKSSSFLRASPNFKKFRKVSNIIPQQRITLSDMYVWDKFDLQNLNVSERT
ncbi:nibrin [Nomia melanderi]|uniref:nibrin n=1 Tax=Nomia melanderi TaxID=2448451 RepID=UPI0013042ED2|nr:nibrin [Nomia melanderi]XP_031837378.1 nibrin [Nomia melanderi]